jgi:hypothetical protein
MPPPAPALAKEYIYSGGKLIATEEPGLNSPTNVIAIQITSSSFTLTWTDNNSDEDGTEIVREINGQNPETITVPANVTTLAQPGLPSGTTFGYVLRAFKGTLYSPPTGVAFGTLSPPCPTVATLSGDGTVGYLEGNVTSARWSSPQAGVVAKDPATNLTTLFISDTNNHRIRKVCLEGASAGASALVAGTGQLGYTEGNGVAVNARYHSPRGITAVIDGSGTASILYIADTNNHMIRKLAWSGSSWTSSKLAGSQQPGSVDSNSGGSVRFNAPQGVVVAPDGFVYVADTGNGRIRKLNQTQGGSTTLVGSGTFTSPVGITVSAAGLLYVGDSSNNKIYSVTAAGAVTALAGSGAAGFADGIGSAAVLNAPAQLAWASTGGEEVVFIADRNNNRVRRLVVSSNEVNAIAGSGIAGFADGTCSSAKFNTPQGIAFSGAAGTIYVIDTGNHRVRQLQ